MKTRSGTLLVVGLLVCSVAAAQGLYAEEPGSPEWGTDSVSYYNIHAFEFVPISSDTTYFFDSWMRYITGGYPALVAGVHLPSGTVVENVSFAVCDEAAGSDIQLRFWECPLTPITAACTPTIIATTAGLNGCDYVGAPGGVPFAIDNATQTYFIEFNGPGGGDVQRRAGGSVRVPAHRGAGGVRDHGRVRRRQLLPRFPADPSPDGGVPGQGPGPPLGALRPDAVGGGRSPSPARWAVKESPVPCQRCRPAAGRARHRAA